MKNDRLIINYETVFILSLHRSQRKKRYMQILYFKSESTNFVFRTIKLRIAPRVDSKPSHFRNAKVFRVIAFSAVESVIMFKSGSIIVMPSVSVTPAANVTIIRINS